MFLLLADFSGVINEVYVTNMRIYYKKSEPDISRRLESFVAL